MISKWEQILDIIENESPTYLVDKEIEYEICCKITEIWNLFNNLYQTHPSDLEDFQHGIHELQKVMAMRKIRRLYPNEYPSYVKINGEWKKRNME